MGLSSCGHCKNHCHYHGHGPFCYEIYVCLNPIANRGLSKKGKQ
jgi:hypothetical protein